MLLNAVIKGEELDIEPWKTMHPPLEDYYQKAFDDLADEEGLCILNTGYGKIQNNA